MLNVILCSFRQGSWHLRANFGLSSVFQAGKLSVLVIWKLKKTSVPSVDQRSVCFVCVVPKKLTKWLE